MWISGYMSTPSATCLATTARRHPAYINWISDGRYFLSQPFKSSYMFRIVLAFMTALRSRMSNHVTDATESLKAPPSVRGKARLVTVAVEYRDGSHAVRHLSFKDVAAPLCYDDMCERLVAEGLKNPDAIIVLPEEYSVQVVDGPSTFELGVGGAININQPFVQYYNHIVKPAIMDVLLPNEAASGDALCSRGVVSPYLVHRNGSGIEVDGVNISFKRTVRVPDNNKKHALPPDMGPFPVYKMEQFASRLPSEIAADNDVFITMYQREAMWISFSTSSTTSFAVRIYAGGVNALSGLTQDASSGGTQDYVAVKPEGGQLWLDGISTSTGYVRQFVAMPLGEGYTVEGQITGKENVGGLQIEVFPAMPATLKVNRSDAKHNSMDVYKSPGELGLVVGDNVVITDRQLDCLSRILSKTQTTAMVASSTVKLVAYAEYDLDAPLTVKSSDDGDFNIPFPSANEVAAIKSAIVASKNIATSQQTLSFQGHALQGGDYLTDHGIVPGSTVDLEMPPSLTDFRPRGRVSMPGATSTVGLAPGGRIAQKVVKDSLPQIAYDFTCGTRVRIAILSSPYFSSTMGRPLPKSPINSKTYQRLGLPWYELYEEHVPVANNFSVPNALTEVQSVGALDVRKDALPCSSCTGEKATKVLRPCGHRMCGGCAVSKSCLSCGVSVTAREAITFSRNEEETGVEAGSKNTKLKKVVVH